MGCLILLTHKPCERKRGYHDTVSWMSFLFEILELAFRRHREFKENRATEKGLGFIKVRLMRAALGDRRDCQNVFLFVIIVPYVVEHCTTYISQLEQHYSYGSKGTTVVLLCN